MSPGRSLDPVSNDRARGMIVAAPARAVRRDGGEQNSAYGSLRTFSDSERADVGERFGDGSMKRFGVPALAIAFAAAILVAAPTFAPLERIRGTSCPASPTRA